MVGAPGPSEWRSAVTLPYDGFPDLKADGIDLKGKQPKIFRTAPSGRAAEVSVGGDARLKTPKEAAACVRCWGEGGDSYHRWYIKCHGEKAAATAHIKPAAATVGLYKVLRERGRQVQWGRQASERDNGSRQLAWLWHLVRTYYARRKRNMCAAGGTDSSLRGERTLDDPRSVVGMPLSRLGVPVLARMLSYQWALWSHLARGMGFGGRCWPSTVLSHSSSGHRGASWKQRQNGWSLAARDCDGARCRRAQEQIPMGAIDSSPSRHVGKPPSRSHRPESSSKPPSGPASASRLSLQCATRAW